MQMYEILLHVRELPCRVPWSTPFLVGGFSDADDAEICVLVSLAQIADFGMARHLAKGRSHAETDKVGASSNSHRGNPARGHLNACLSYST